tara:strand:- start:13 stop:222 length:210 start_codon:yes stop_codon:yes gene_type:complete
MFGLGLSEWMIIGVGALLVLKPEDLPRFARQMGTYYQKCQRMVQELNRDIRAIELPPNDATPSSTIPSQ